MARVDGDASSAEDSAAIEILEEDEREHVSAVELEHWHGAPDDGRWVVQTTLKVPQSKLAKMAA